MRDITAGIGVGDIIEGFGDVAEGIGMGDISDEIGVRAITLGDVTEGIGAEECYISERI